MEIRPLSSEYAVSPQVNPGDFATIRAAGYTTVINNRPDAEIPATHHSHVMRAAAEAAGLIFIENPVVSGALTMENINLQAKAQADSSGPVLAYCASGNRCSIVWSLTQAGKMRTEAILAAAERAGYHLEHLKPQIDALATGAG